MPLPFRDDLLSSLLARCKRAPLSRFSQPLFWLLLLLLAQQCAGLTWRLFSLTQTTQSQPWQPSITTSQGAGASRLDLSGLSRLSLFGKAQQLQPDQAAQMVAADAPKTQLSAQLNGVLASSDPAKSIAIIAHNGLQNSYGIDDYIDGTQAKIRQIFADRVIILRDGRDETLMLDGEEYGKPLPKVAPPKENKLSSVRGELMGNPGKITDYLNISPVRVDGRMAGYRLNPGSNPELFNQLGLVAGDLAISINGLDLRDNAQAMQAMQQMAGATEMTVTVERQGQPYDVYIGLSE